MELKSNQSFRRGKIKGYIRTDVFGRLFIDACETDEEHLTNPRVEPGLERPGCRKYFSDLVVPEEMLGKKVYVTYEVHIILSTES
jgi:hypothetical protein